MAIVEILENKLDVRKGGDECEFNGYLEDYILDIDELEMDETIKEALKLIAEEDNQAKICVNLRMAVNKDAISNQIIRYKDVFKLTGKPIILPYIIYGEKNDADRALLLVPYEKYGYLFAKGYYYSMTEPGSDFSNCKNEIVAISMDNATSIFDAYKRLYSVTAGSLQRSIDHSDYTNYESLKENAIECANEIRDKAVDVLTDLEDKTDAIYLMVIKWFLLKKVLYVQYMVNKDILNRVHDGIVKKQRNQAKLNSEEIKFMSFSELWRCTGQNQAKEEKEITN
ncbi:MAG: hypothetical protein GX675_05305 [Erysipelotrichaceae bacterium]|nr:hypothetical protein [Erysipelotrichaceae bacterium]